jgi:hypothetical protein
MPHDNHAELLRKLVKDVKDLQFQVDCLLGRCRDLQTELAIVVAFAGAIAIHLHSGSLLTAIGIVLPCWLVWWTVTARRERKADKSLEKYRVTDELGLWRGMRRGEDEE